METLTRKNKLIIAAVLFGTLVIGIVIGAALGSHGNRGYGKRDGGRDGYRSQGIERQGGYRQGGDKMGYPNKDNELVPTGAPAGAATPTQTQ